MTNTQNVTPTPQQRKLINDAIAVYEDVLIENYVEYTEHLRVYDVLETLSLTLNTLAACNYQIGSHRILDLIALINDILEDDNIFTRQYESNNKAAITELNNSLDEIYSSVEKTTVTENTNTDITNDELFNIPADLHLSVSQAASEARINARVAEAAEAAVLEALKFTNALRTQPQHTSTYKDKLSYYVNTALARVAEADRCRDNYIVNTYKDKENQ